MRARHIALPVTIGMLAIAATPAGANGAVAITGANRSGNSATVSGTVTFPEVTGAQDVGGTRTNYANAATQAAGEAAGLTLTGAEITPIAGGLRFTWKVNSMPSEVPPEGVRYNWAVNIGANVYQLQAKRTSLASVNVIEDPKGHIEQAAAQKSFFQLRGNCVTNYFPQPAPAVNGCYHYGFLNGSFDVANKRISMDWPFETRDSVNRIVAPDFKPGAVLTPHDGSKSAGMSIAASFQAVVSNTTTSNYINAWNPYFIGGQVQLGVGPANSDPSGVEYTATATVNGGSFTGSISGLTTFANTVFIRACNGTTCAYTSVRP